MTQKQATENHIKTISLERSVMHYWGFKPVLRIQPNRQLLTGYKHSIVGCTVRMIIL